MTRTRKTFSLEQSANLALERVGNYSDYVGKLVLQHARDWTESLARLRRAQWQPEEILAACDALGAHGLSNEGRGGVWLAQELARLEDEAGHFRQRSVPVARRRACFADLAENPEIAHALATVVREFWLENEDCRRAVRATKTR